MTTEEIAVKLEDHEHEIGSLKHRMKAAEEANHALNRLATAVEVMATKQEAMSESVKQLSGKVDTLESKPGRRWESLTDKLLYGAAGAVLAWLAAGVPGI
jgi:hypothetical protein